MSRYSLIGSSHLFGITDRFVRELPANAVHRAWATGVPVTGPLDLGGPSGWQGEYVLFNTPAAGPPPEFDGKVLYLPDELGRVLSHVSADTEVVFSLMRGHEYAIVSLVDDPAHGDFNDAVSHCLPGRPWMSLADATAWVREFSAPLFATLLALRRQFPRARVVHLPPPPPIESEEHILAHPEAFGPLFAQHGIKPFAARARLYRLMLSDMAERLRAYGVDSLPPPPGSLTPAGGLKAEHARGCLHGNQAYAEGLATQIREVLAHVASV
ncbi:hypothetical protein ACG04R_22430 [Roseateles sp. BYS78W]|uniref:Uncharacterized protein n=1 Tax=Pelomonas candidula TaxID=3299025 RepID=A0ABW7HHQ4_9BURK